MLFILSQDSLKDHNKRPSFQIQVPMTQTQPQTFFYPSLRFRLLGLKVSALSMSYTTFPSCGIKIYDKCVTKENPDGFLYVIVHCKFSFLACKKVAYFLFARDIIQRYIFYPSQDSSIGSI